MTAAREGEEALDFDPADLPGDASLVFIGRVRSPWRERADCPKNMNRAREAGKPASVEIDARYRKGLKGLERFSHVVVLTWLDRSRRDLMIQNPRHADEPRGTFSLRSPVRPNPVGLHTARLVSLDPYKGILELEAIDVLDGTPVIDVKPYFPSIDSLPDATTA